MCRGVVRVYFNAWGFYIYIVRIIIKDFIIIYGNILEMLCLMIKITWKAAVLFMTASFSFFS